MADDMQEVRLPFTDFVRQVVRLTAQEVIDEHVVRCAVKAEVIAAQEEIKTIKGDVVSLKLRWATLAGLLLGSGTLGGVAGAVVSMFTGGGPAP